jgi:hypothetical protein
MLKAVGNRERLARMGDAARATAEARYDVAKVNAQLLSIMRLDRGRREAESRRVGGRALAIGEA